MSEAVKDVSASFDALVDLFECIGNFLSRLDIYTKIPPTAAMTDVVVKIIVELISTLALATKQVKQGRPSECQCVLVDASLYSRRRRETSKEAFGRERGRGRTSALDRLTQDEARMTAAPTLEVVYGLVQNMKVVMDGA